MKREVRGSLHLGKRKKTDFVGLSNLFKRPANARITCQSLAAIRRRRKSGNGGNQLNALGSGITPLCVTKLLALSDFLATGRSTGPI
jgi:hypothetical protein